MGTWGISIYSCDIAEDVKEACNAIFAFCDIEDGNKRLFSAFSNILHQDFIDNEYASFWYALSDWQWKHGMLNAYVKEKTLHLLENYVGLDEWEYDDIPRRRMILDQLKKRLTQPQSMLKKPRIKVSKPKHAPGDIIVFQACDYNEAEICNKWRIKSLAPPLFFQSSRFRNSRYKDIDGYDASGKYMALLCVGTVKERHSEYIDDIFDEYSLYVWYDYLSFDQPSIKDLGVCGFLPYIDWEWKDFNRNITESIDWGYEFTVVCEKFKSGKEINLICTLNDFGEVERYRQLISQKSYSSDYYGGFTVADMFSTVFSEKNRANLIGGEYDNLLKNEIQAPRLLSPREVDASFQKYIKGSIE